MTAIGELVTPTGHLVLPPNASREDWLAARRWRDGVPGGFCIGSSEVPSLMDLDGVDTPVHVYRRKIGRYETAQNEAMTWGSLLEAPIANEWCRRNRAVIDEIGLVSRDGAPWHQCTIDRRVRECPIEPGLVDGCLLEVKSVSYPSASRWHAGIPDRIYAQILHQLWVTGYRHAHFACLVGGNLLQQGVIRADREHEVIDYIVAEVDAFRENHLIPRIEPAWDTSRKADKLIELDKATHPERIGEIDLDGIGEVMEYAEATAALTAAKKRQEQAKARLLQLADGHEIVTFSGERAFWFGTQTRSSADLDKLAEGWPDAYEACVRETVSHPLYIDRAYKNGGGR